MRTPSRVPNASGQAAPTTWVATRELPPQFEENRPSRPTFSTASTSAMMSAMTCLLRGLRGRDNPCRVDREHRLRKRLAIQLAAGVQRERNPAPRARTGSCSSAATARKEHTEWPRNSPRHRATGTRYPTNCCPVAVSTTSTTSLAHRRMGEQRRLDLAEFDSLAAELHLEVGASDVIQYAVRGAGWTKSAGAVTSVHPESPNGSATNRSEVRSGRPR